MITEIVLMAFAVLFCIALFLLIYEAHRSEARRLEILKQGDRINDLEDEIATSGIKILEIQGELTEAEDNRNALLNLNAELKSELDLETGACKELDSQIIVLKEELDRRDDLLEVVSTGEDQCEIRARKVMFEQIVCLDAEADGALEWINRVVHRLKRARAECDRQYQMNQRQYQLNQLPTGSDFGTNT